MDKIFRNIWDVWHFVGGGIFGTLLFFIYYYGLPYVHIPFVVVSLIFFTTLFLGLPVFWEYWDRFKVPYDSFLVLDWTDFQKALFTSEGKFDWHDVALTYAGIFSGLIFCTWHYNVFYI